MHLYLRRPPKDTRVYLKSSKVRPLRDVNLRKQRSIEFRYQSHIEQVNPNVQPGSLRHFHVFLWFLGNLVQPRSTGSNKTKRPNRDIDAGNAEPQESLKTPFAVDKDRLDETFSAMDETLRSQYKHHRTYKKCSSHTLQDVESRMRDISLEGKPGAIGDDESIVSTSDRGALAYGPTADEMDYVKDHRGQLYSRRAPVPLAVRITVLETFVKGAKVLFDFFLPLGYTCSMVAKYWGAIYDLIDVSTGAFKFCMKYSR